MSYSKMETKVHTCSRDPFRMFQHRVCACVRVCVHSIESSLQETVSVTDTVVCVCVCMCVCVCVCVRWQTQKWNGRS